MLFKLIEKEAGETLYKKEFSAPDSKAAEWEQSERWNENYAHGEPRVSSRLYKFHNSRWRLIMNIGV